MSQFTTPEIAADYRKLLEHGRVEKWELHNSGDDECGPWWSALEQLASSDGLRVRRCWSNLGAGSFFVPCLVIVRPDGAEYVVPGARTAEAAAAEIQRRMQDDWGDTLVDARARHRVVTSG